ncbi:hypothetical protein [Rhodovulum marinum]|uniref:STAS domain-containing protein n=1 Tax=Rhodovulum marinum TaxID=320662 RepID=A0A4R2Q5E9_9RHOB|nr:hypothetical protein [Rhodovulum marinum]TCP41895.1 hypothetical protein EV662_104239 [Rhodovulum marinum]
MDSDRQIDLDINDPAWADAPGDIVKSVLGEGPHSVTVRASGAPTALSAQVLTVLRRHVEAGGGSFSVPEPSADFVEGLTLLGLRDAILGPEGVQ